MIGGHRCVRKDLIAKELSRIDGIEFRKEKLSNSFVDWLFHRYKTHEFTVHYYDEDLELMNEIGDEDENPWWKTSEGQKCIQENEERRITFNNWIDPYGEGIWGMSQEKVDKYARSVMEGVKNWPVKKTDRVYFGVKGMYAFVYCYGRDFLGEDYWWIMESKRNHARNEWMGFV